MFKIGDVVILVGAATAFMTVEYVSHTGNIDCVWFDRNLVLHRATLPSTILVKANVP